MKFRKSEDEHYEEVIAEITADSEKFKEQMDSMTKVFRSLADAFGPKATPMPTVYGDDPFYGS